MLKSKRRFLEAIGVQPWIIFVLSSLAIILAGRKLSQYGEGIAAVTGLGKAWIGAILVAGATSLPEVATSMAAARQGWGNLAMGNVFGSNIFNIAVIVVAQFFARKSILAHVGPSHVTVASAGMVLSGVAAMAMLVKFPVMVAGAGVDALIIAGAYLLMLPLLPREDHGGEGEPEAPGPSAPGSAVAVWLRFGMASTVVVVAGWFLSGAADQIAAATGLGQTFVGGTLLAAATSLPELTVTVVAARRGSFDLAIGNVLGSNIFNMLIIVLSDFTLPGPRPLLSTADPGPILAAMLGLVLSAITALSLTARHRENVPNRYWDVIAIGAAYLAGTWLLYTLR